MDINTVTFELTAGNQIFKNPSKIKLNNGSYKTVGYIQGIDTIDVSKHPQDATYASVYFPYSRFNVTEPALIDFLKAQQSFSEIPNEGRIWIHNSQEKAKQNNQVRKMYVEAMNYIDSLDEETLNVKAFAKLGVVITSLTKEEILDSLYNIAGENPEEILMLKNETTFDFIGRAIYLKIIELVKGDFYLYGERHNLLYKTPTGMNAKERFAEFLNTTQGKPVADLILSKIKSLSDDYLFADNKTLIDVPGIGEHLQSKLIDAGITSILQLSEYDVESITAKLYDSGYILAKSIKIHEIINKAKNIIAFGNSKDSIN